MISLWWIVPLLFSRHAAADAIADDDLLTFITVSCNQMAMFFPAKQLTTTPAAGDQSAQIRHHVP